MDLLGCDVFYDMSLHMLISTVFVCRRPGIPERQGLGEAIMIFAFKNLNE